MARRINSLIELRAFSTAARLLSFTRAADELNLTQGAISRQIKNLEKTLGVELFHRQKKGLRLTEEGLRLLPDINSALDLLDRATSALAELSACPRLFVRVPPTLALRWLIPRLSDFGDRHPEIEVQLATSLGATMEGFDLARDRIDVAIARIEVPRPDTTLRFDYLMADDHVPVCSAKLLDGPEPLSHPDDLVHHKLLHAITRPRAWRSWLEHVGVSGIDPDNGLFFDHYHFAIQAAIDGLGVTVAPRPLIENDLAEGRLVIPFDLVAPSGSAYYVVSRTDGVNNRSAAVFRDWLLAADKVRRGSMPQDASRA